MIHRIDKYFENLMLYLREIREELRFDQKFIIFRSRISFGNKSLENYLYIHIYLEKEKINNNLFFEQ